MVCGAQVSAGTGAGVDSWTQPVVYTISLDQTEQRQEKVAEFVQVKPEEQVQGEWNPSASHCSFTSTEIHLAP